MKILNRNTIKIGFPVVALSLWSVAAGAQTRLNRAMWTDRSLTNPPFVEQASIDTSLEGFWNLPEEPKVTKSCSSVKRPMDTRVLSDSVRKGASMEQKREVRERRGFFGINLFNLIPLIDIVHGEVTTESSDRVRGRK